MWFDPHEALTNIRGGVMPPSEPIENHNPSGLAQLARLARPAALENHATEQLESDGLGQDAITLLDHLARHGPSTYGAAAVALGWGATRSWHAEAALRAAELVTMNHRAQAAPVASTTVKRPMPPD